MWACASGSRSSRTELKCLTFKPCPKAIDVFFDGGLFPVFLVYTLRYTNWLAALVQGVYTANNRAVTLRPIYLYLFRSGARDSATL